MLRRPVLYSGLEDMFYGNLTDESSLVMESTLNLELGGVSVIQYSIIDAMEVPVCSAFTANDYSKYDVRDKIFHKNTPAADF